MGVCANKCCWKRNRVKGPFNEIRLLEFILCTICLIYFAVVRVNVVPIGGYFLLLLALPTMFVIITLFDLIVIWAMWPIGWRAWVMFSLFAALFFFLSAGLTPATGLTHYWILLIFFLITAIVFLLDAFCIIRLMRFQDLSGVSNRICQYANQSMQVLPLNVVTPDPNSLHHVPILPRTCKHRGKCGESCPHYSKAQLQTTSYGGTFPVSKEFTPMPGPTSGIKSKPPHESVTFSNQDEKMPKVPPTRTVSVTTRMVLKKDPNFDMTPLKSPFENESEGSSTNTKKNWRTRKAFKNSPYICYLPRPVNKHS